MKKRGEGEEFKFGRKYIQYTHREIKEEWKSGNISEEIRIGPKGLKCAVAALNIGVPPLFKIGRIC